MSAEKLELGDVVTARFPTQDPSGHEQEGYRPAVAPGLAACVAAPLVAYWVGVDGLPLVVAFAFIAGAIGFIGAGGVESGPLPNMAVTTMGVVWIGLLGSPVAGLLLVLLQVAIPGWLSAFLVCAFVGGFCYLVATMGQRPSDDWSGDDGAVV